MLWDIIFIYVFFACIIWLFKGFIQVIIGVPLVFWDKIQEYRSGQMPRKEIRLWKVVFVLWGIIALLLTFIYLGANR